MQWKWIELSVFIILFLALETICKLQRLTNIVQCQSAYYIFNVMIL